MICKIRITLQTFLESSNLIRAKVYIADKLKFYAQNITRGSTLDYRGMNVVLREKLLKHAIYFNVQHVLE